MHRLWSAMDNITECVEVAESLTGSTATDVALSVSLLVLSGLFSGLTLGLMSLDVSGLDIVISGGDPQEAEYAKKILPLRRKGNLLLCTLLLGNTLVNALIAILSASFTSGLVGALLSTGFIVVFGEIMPQSVCSRYGLLIGAYTVNIVKCFVVLLFPVAYPVARILDWVLGQEMVSTCRALRPTSTVAKAHNNRFVLWLRWCIWNCAAGNDF